jgi:hypothetical protein
VVVSSIAIDLGCWRMDMCRWETSEKDETVEQIYILPLLQAPFKIPSHHRPPIHSGDNSHSGRTFTPASNSVDDVLEARHICVTSGEVKLDGVISHGVTKEREGGRLGGCLGGYVPD